MASNNRPRLSRFLLAVALGLLSVAFADDGDPASRTRETGKSFYYSYDAQGELAFIQILSWQGDANALSYEVEVRDSAGNTVIERETDETSLEVSLAAGDYGYRVSAINLLGKRERVGPWLAFTVKKAVKPEVDWISPDDLYLDDGEFVVTVGGTGFADGVTVCLVESETSGVELWGEISESSRGRITVVFPPDMLESGEFSVKVVNPSGLSGVSRERLTIGYREGSEYFASVGYAPFIAVLDPWFTDLWDDVLYPAGFTIRGGSLIGRRKSSRFGFEARLAGRFMTAERDSVTVDATVFQLGVGLVYKRELGEKLSLVARLGAGIAATAIIIDLNGISGDKDGSFDPASYIGAAAQYRLRDSLYAEFGTDFEIIFYKDFISAGFSPSLAIGYLLKP